MAKIRNQRQMELAAAAPQREYHTYLKDAVKAKGRGDMVHFSEGKGYWLAPRPSAAPPRLTPTPVPRTVDPVTGLVQQAGRIATNALTPEKAEIERQRALAAARAKGDQAAMLGLAQTVAEMQKGIGPGIQGAYSGAAGEIAGLAQGFSQGMAARMTEGQEAAEAFASSQGGGDMQIGPNVQDAQDVSYGLGGFIPGRSLEEQGAAANAWRQAIPAITAAALKGDYQRAMFEARSQDDEYAQQLIATAAKFPQLRDQALQELRNYELQKGAAKRDQQQIALQERAQKLYEAQFGETKSENAADDVYRWGQLTLETAKAQAAVQAAADKGRKPNASLSKTYGYIVDSDGNPILQNGKRIKVVNSTGKAKAKPYAAAVKEARTLRGAPVEADPDKPINGKRPRGKYVSRDGVKGDFPDGTTNNSALAKHNGMGFLEALGYLAAAHGISRAEARKALIAAGYKPDGARP